MAKRSKSGVNKSKAIRDYMAGNPMAKPKEIAAALAEQGVPVTPAFVGTIRSNDKRKGGKKARRGRPPGRPSATSGASVGIDSLIQAKQLADKMGGVAKARQALEALAMILAE